MNTAHTIAACASAHGRSPRAVIRAFGPDAARALEKLTGLRPSSRALSLARLRIGGDELPALCAWYSAGASYSGDPGFELLIPGNPALVDRVLATLLAIDGVRTAEPGEFTARALLSGRLSLSQAEGVGAMVAAQNSEQLHAARLALAGDSGRAFLAWADELAALSALVEAGIDFTDQEDVVAITPRELGARLRALRAEIVARAGAERGAEARAQRVRVAIFGAPNAGKSTLFNALLGRERSVVSPVAGSTRDVIEEEWILPGVGALTLQDLAGLDARAPGPSARAAQDAAASALREADVVVWCDPRGAFDVQDAPPGAARIIRARTFADRPHERAQGIEICALDGYGLDALRRAITDGAWDAASGGGARAGVLPRQRRVMGALLDDLARANALCDATGERLREPELIAEVLRAALDHAGELVGRIGVEELLGRIFSTFCVGK